jgi:hypothetical protein
MKPTMYTICPAEIRWAMIDFEFNVAKYSGAVQLFDFQDRDRL